MRQYLGLCYWFMKISEDGEQGILEEGLRGPEISCEISRPIEVFSGDRSRKIKKQNLSKLEKVCT